MDPREFRRIMSRFPTGVTVVTARGPEGEPSGVTASSFTSVSLDPLLVLVCLDLRSETLPRIEAAGAFAVNILGAAAESLAWRFAANDRDGRFAGLALEFAPGGSPLLEEAVAWLECRLWRTVDAGDHRLVLGAVTSGGVREGEPLVWFGGGFRRLVP